MPIKRDYAVPEVYVEGIKEDTRIKNFVHCYIPGKVPKGYKHLWAIEYPIKPINIKSFDSSNLLLELAFFDRDEVRGERIVSRILFRSSFVLGVYKKILSIEILTKKGVIPYYKVRAYNRDLEKAFNELFYLIEGYDGMIYNRETKQFEVDKHIFHNKRIEREERLKKLHSM